MSRDRQRRGRLTCREVGRKLQAHLDGELDPTEAEAVADHLGSCADCDFEAGVYRGIKEALRRRRPSLPDETVSWIRELADSLVRGDTTDAGGGSRGGESSP